MLHGKLLICSFAFFANAFGDLGDVDKKSSPEEIGILNVEFLGCSDGGGTAEIVYREGKVLSLMAVIYGSIRVTRFNILDTSSGSYELTVRHTYTDKSEVKYYLEVVDSSNKYTPLGMSAVDFAQIFSTDLLAIRSYYQLVEAAMEGEIQDGAVLRCL
jgi:hypothetical protein